MIRRMILSPLLQEKICNVRKSDFPHLLYFAGSGVLQIVRENLAKHTRWIVSGSVAAALLWRRDSISLTLMVRCTSFEVFSFQPLTASCRSVLSEMLCLARF